MTTRVYVASRTLRDVATESAVIPLRAASLLFRHLPQLVTLVCLGLAGRQAVIWLATWVSDYSSFAASLIMPLAPLSVMLSLIFCLWALRPSLPFLSATFPGLSETSTRTRLLSAGGMLISFLTVYATHGMLKEDLSAFRRAATFDEYQNQFFEADFNRAFVNSTGALIALVVGTIVLRKIVGYFALAERGLGFTYLSAYLEVLWMTTVSVFLTNRLAAVQDWALTRQSLAPAYRKYLELKTTIADSFGPLGDAWAWLAAKLPALNQLITVPIAWLTLGAVVFGTSLVAKEVKDNAAEAEAISDPPETAPQPARAHVRTRLKSAAGHEAKHAVDEAVKPVAGPVKTTWKGLKALSRAGLIPMTIFCLVFMLATVVELGIVELGRAIIGPQDPHIGYPLGAYILIVSRAAYLLVVVCLIASALDFFLRHSYSPAAGSGAPAGAGGGASTGASGAGAAVGAPAGGAPAGGAPAGGTSALGAGGASAGGAGADDGVSTNSSGSGSTIVT